MECYCKATTGRSLNSRDGVIIPAESPRRCPINLSPAWIVLAVLYLAHPFASTVFSEDSVGVKVPDGFTVSLFADDDLAHDIYSMTVDSLGRVAVSGPGYVRFLVDENKDGKADRAIQFADGPKSGAQGMYFRGRDLLCIGDAGLIRYRDQDGDDRADGPPDVFLKLKTGGEHHAHAIRKGPDGWWYMIAGNHAGITSAYATLPSSPVKKPQSGTLIRLKPDLSSGEIIADGFRNAYDFAFNRQGDIFTFDSDGERDVSLPWYRPTRVFHVLPGSNAGWFSRSWKRPDYFLGMPPVIGSFGRGSPTGVAVYRHRQFPKQYDNAVFALDWTFGRVIALQLERNGSTWSSKPIDFMTSVGQFGFAPTDIEIGSDGSLFVSVGGRGTRGGVFRVTHKSGAKAINPAREPRTKLRSCLTAPQPLSSWSRAHWMPLAQEVGVQPFVAATIDQKLSTNQRLRAIEIVTELFGGLDDVTLKTLAQDTVAEVRARAVWSVGRSRQSDFKSETIGAFLTDSDPLVSRCALETVATMDVAFDFRKLNAGIINGLKGADRFQRQAAVRVVPRLTKVEFRELSLKVRDSGWQAGLTNAVGYLQRKPGFNAYAFQIGLLVLEDDHPRKLKLQAIRLMQLGLGDVGPVKQRVPVFDGYASRIDLEPHERELDDVRIRLSKLFPTDEHLLDFELGRLLAMLTPYNPKLLDKVLEKLTDDSDPVHDVHYLIVAARIPVARTAKQSDIIAKALVNLEPKIIARQLKQDSNWDDRIGEMYAEQVKLDESLPETMLGEQQFGQPGHVLFLSQLPADLLPKAIAAFVRQLDSQQDNYAWNNDVIFLLGESKDKAHRQMVRQQFENFSVRSAVLMVLAESPQPTDREKFVKGLDSSQIEVLKKCAAALAKLDSSDDGDEQAALVKAVRRLGTDKREFPVREELIKLLRRNTKQQFGFHFGEKGHTPQRDVLAKWTNWVAEAHPAQSGLLLGGSGADIVHLKELMTNADWSQGDVARGQKLFTTRSCAQCHGGRRALGPDLAGVAGRFSRNDLFTAIASPNRDVSPRYQTTLIQTESGQVYSGLIVYQSVDGVLLRDVNNKTFRIESDEIEFQRKLPQSLMPKGLLKDLKPQDLADLYSYIRSLGANANRVSARDGS